MFQGELSKPLLWRPAYPDDHLVEQADLVDARQVGAEVVDELPDDRRADERDGHRQEDKRLGQGLHAGLVDENGVDQSDAGRDERGQDDPHRGIAQHDELVVVSEDLLVVVKPDELVAGRVEERFVRGFDSGVDEADRQAEDGRPEEDDRDSAVTVAAVEAAGNDDQKTHKPHEDRNGKNHRSELLGCTHGDTFRDGETWV